MKGFGLVCMFFLSFYFIFFEREGEKVKKEAALSVPLLLSLFFNLLSP